jgi:RNA polymerase sigma-70 factor (ECF subfamily)
MRQDDLALARRCQQGDVAAYAELVRRHRRMVLGAARSVLGSTEEAEDVAQEAFVRAYRSIRQHDGRSAFCGWVRRITVNCAVSRLRQRRREQRRAVELGSLSRSPSSGPDPSERVLSAETDRAIRDAVAALPPKQRLAIALFHLEGMGLAGAALAMGCSVNAVKANLHRARRRLACELAGELEGVYP